MGLVRMAQTAEDAGFDGVMVSEHVVLGTGADADGVPANPRDYALPGNQDPSTPWPSSMVLLAAVAAATTRVRLVASAVIPPLRHPLLIAKDLATLDLLSGGRLVVQPTVSWHRAEYEALGVPFTERGARLDEHLEAWTTCGARPGHLRGPLLPVRGHWLEPKPFRARRSSPVVRRPDGCTIALLARLARYGHGFNPLGRPSDAGHGAARGGHARRTDATSPTSSWSAAPEGGSPTPDAVADLDEAFDVDPRSDGARVRHDLHQAQPVHR